MEEEGWWWLRGVEAGGGHDRLTPDLQPSTLLSSPALCCVAGLSARRSIRDLLGAVSHSATSLNSASSICCSMCVRVCVYIFLPSGNSVSSCLFLSITLCFSPHFCSLSPYFFFPWLSLCLSIPLSFIPPSLSLRLSLEMLIPGPGRLDETELSFSH